MVAKRQIRKRMMMRRPRRLMGEGHVMAHSGFRALGSEAASKQRERLASPVAFVGNAIELVW
jgi:hypothetical protein